MQKKKKWSDVISAELVPPGSSLWLLPFCWLRLAVLSANPGPPGRYAGASHCQKVSSLALRNLSEASSDLQSVSVSIEVGCSQEGPRCPGPRNGWANFPRFPRPRLPRLSASCLSILITKMPVSERAGGGMGSIRPLFSREGKSVGEFPRPRSPSYFSEGTQNISLPSAGWRPSNAVQWDPLETGGFYQLCRWKTNQLPRTVGSDGPTSKPVTDAGWDCAHPQVWPLLLSPLQGLRCRVWRAGLLRVGGAVSLGWGIFLFLSCGFWEGSVPLRKNGRFGLGGTTESRSLSCHFSTSPQMFATPASPQATPAHTALPHQSLRWSAAKENPGLCVVFKQHCGFISNRFQSPWQRDALLPFMAACYVGHSLGSGPQSSQGKLAPAAKRSSSRSVCHLWS